MAYAKSVEEFFTRESPWTDELLTLRDICLSTGMDEALKWGMPHYHHEGRNLLGICSFKSYFGIWFHYGHLLSDPAAVLINAQSGKTKKMRQWRMHAAADIDAARLKSYLIEAMETAKDI